MPKKPKALFEAYQSYRGDDDAHRIRLLLIAATSAVLSLVSSNLSAAALPAMALAVSVLAGFTFTALFSSGTLSTHDLPLPRDESDQLDKKKLKLILKNFRARAKLFLYISVFALLLILLVSIDFNWGAITESCLALGCEIRMQTMTTLKVVHFWLSKGVTAIAFFIFLEMFYLFFRLSESVFSFLEIRKKYLESKI